MNCVDSAQGITRLNSRKSLYWCSLGTPWVFFSAGTPCVVLRNIHVGESLGKLIFLTELEECSRGRIGVWFNLVVEILFSEVETLSILEMYTQMDYSRISLMDWEAEYSPECFTTTYVASMLVICYFISVTGEECEYSLVSSFVDVLTHIFDGLDWVAIFHVDMCIKGFAQQRTVADHPFVVNSDLSLVPLTNSSCETTIIRRSSSVLGITIFTRVLSFPYQFLG